MKAMILAGGLSTRLYPLTRTVPKPLVPIAGEPNAVHLLRYLRAFGIVEIAINVHYLASRIEAALGDGSAYGVRLTYLREAQLSGSAGAVARMRSFFADDAFIVVGCDAVTDVPLADVLAAHRARTALATIALVEAPEVAQYGVVVLDDADRIVRFQEKPAPGEELSHLVNTGIYVFEPAIFAHIPSDGFSDFGRQVFPALQAAEARFFGYVAPDAYWCDVGTLAEYRRASADVLGGRVRIADGSRLRGVASDARVASSARLSGDVHIGTGARIAEDVVIVGPAVIGRDVVVGAGAVLERTILWDRTTIGPHARLSDCVVGTDCAIAAEALLSDVVIANEPECAAE